MLFFLYEWLFGHCLLCKKAQVKIGICTCCLEKFKKYNCCFHNSRCLCGQDVIPYYYNYYSKKILIQAKYADNYYATRFIGQSIVRLIKIKPDFLVPIPTSKKKLFWKGYNTPNEICKIISEELNIPIIYPLKKEKSTYQKGKTHDERLKNVKWMIFHYDKDIKNKTIAIIDDLIASGSTIKRSQELMAAHCKKIYVYAFCKT